jgi:SNF2 family DNA or RNA helicase
VVTPNSFKGGWPREGHKHGYHFAWHIYDADKHARATRWLADGFTAPPILVVNYEALRLLKVQDLLKDFTVRPTMLVADESIALKNPSAKRTKALLRLADRFCVKRILTGKPTTQGAHDLHQQLTLIGAAPMPYYPFRNLFCEMGGFEGRQVVGVKTEEKLKSIMAPFVFRATKKEWLPTLPDKAYTTRTYALTPELANHYNMMEDQFMTWVDDHYADGAKAVMVELALTKYMKLAQIHAGFIYDEGGLPQWLVDDKHNPRLALLEEILDEIESKVCIAFRHRFVGEQLKRVLTLRGLYPAVLEGNMPPAQIEEEKGFFNDDPRCRAILLQVDAAKYGHTLIGSEDDPCYTMVFYENTYSLDTRSQLEDRIHRTGQKSACLYIDLAGTEMDLRVVAALQAKEKVHQRLFGEPLTQRTAPRTWTSTQPGNAV